MRINQKITKIMKILFVFLILIALAAGVYTIFPLNKTMGNYKCPDCNIIIISLTNVGAKHLGTYGYYRNTSPNIDKFAEESLVFENAFSHSSWTLPSGISLFTSLYPFSHGVMDRNNDYLKTETQTLVDIMKKNGYKTAAFTGGFDYRTKFGLTNRFDVLSTDTEHLEKESRDFSVNEVGVLASSAPDALEWLKFNKDGRFFLFVQGFDAHCPFTPPQPYDELFYPEYQGNLDTRYCYWTFDKAKPYMINNKTYYEVTISAIPITVNTIILSEEDVKYMVAQYDGEIAFVDSVIGDFLEEIEGLGLLKNTIIVITSEHGDIFGKHGRFMRGGPLRGTFYDDVVHIPLIIRHPEIGPRRIEGVVQIIDVMPTLLSFLRMPVNNDAEGKSLLPLIVNNQSVHEFIFGGSQNSPNPANKNFNISTRIEYVRSKDWKLLREALFLEGNKTEIDYELYNLKEDPEELSNIYYNKNIEKIREDLREGLFDWLNQFNETPPFKS